MGNRNSTVPASGGGGFPRSGSGGIAPPGGQGGGGGFNSSSGSGNFDASAPMATAPSEQRLGSNVSAEEQAQKEADAQADQTIRDLLKVYLPNVANPGALTIAEFHNAMRISREVRSHCFLTTAFLLLLSYYD